MNRMNHHPERTQDANMSINPITTILIVALTIAAAASHLRAARYRRERDEARGKVERMWKQVVGVGGGAVGAVGTRTTAPVASVAPVVTLDRIPEVSVEEVLFGAESVPASVTAVEADTNDSDGEPVILPFRKFWTPATQRSGGMT